MIKWLIRFFKRLFKRSEPISDVKVEVERGDCKVKLTKGWVSAYLVKRNKRTCWVQLFDMSIINRKNRLIKI